MEILRRVAAALVLLSVGNACMEGRDRDTEFVKAVLELAGCTDVEEVGEEEMERYADLFSSPLRINYASRSRLMESGLFSAYQVAVLLDYRGLSGDVLSLEELSSLDGFGHGFVSALDCFISLDSNAAPGQSSLSSGIMENRLTVKSGIRNTVDSIAPQGTYSMKYRLTAGESFEAGVSLRSSYQEPHLPPGKLSFFVAYYGRKYPGKIVAGDYTLRFGQGLALWPGFSMNGLSSPDSFSRRPSGISPYNSYSGEGSFRGVAADFGKRRFNVSTFVSGLGLREMMEGGTDFSRDILYGANIGWYGLFGQVSVTGYAVSGLSKGIRKDFPAAVCSADAAFSFFPAPPAAFRFRP